MILSKVFKELAFSILDKSKFRGFHLFRDLRFYASQFNLPVETIFDVGANIGQTSKELRRYFPDSSIHAFEPINSTFEILKENLCEDQKIILNNFALGAEEKEVIISLRDENLINSLLNEINPTNQDVLISDRNYQNYQTQAIKVSQGDKYCSVNNINSAFLLKTDTEGYDLDVLKGFDKKIIEREIFFILVEVTFDNTDLSHTSFARVNEYLASHGYNLSGFYDLIHRGGLLPNLYYCNCLWSSLAIKR